MVVRQASAINFRIVNNTEVAVGAGNVTANSSVKRVLLVKALCFCKRKSAAHIPARANFPIALFAKGISGNQVYVMSAVEVRGVSLQTIEPVRIRKRVSGIKKNSFILPLG